MYEQSLCWQQVEFLQFFYRQFAQLIFIERRIGVRDEMAQALNNLLAHIMVAGQQQFTDGDFDLLPLNGRENRFCHNFSLFQETL